MWDQTDCIDYLKTSAVLAAYVDQSISTNTFYNPAHFNQGKVPATLITKNLMLATKWGLKTMYYSLINKVGSKASLSDSDTVIIPFTKPNEEFSDDDCEACVL